LLQIYFVFGLGLQHKWCMEEGVAIAGMRLFGNVKQWGWIVDGPSFGGTYIFC
jgi:hypothetical protein